MRPRHRSLRVAALLIASGLLLINLSDARREDTEEDLLSRIQRESNPVRKAKYEIRLAGLKLLAAIDAYNKGDLERYRQLLAAYLERIKSSWDTLQKSGRQAARQPQGFKELDITLREDGRLLEDLRRRVPYNERRDVEEVEREVDRIRNEVLRALFPAERPAGASRRLVHLTLPASAVPISLL